MNKIRKYFYIGVRVLRSLPKTIYVNYKCLPFKQAMKLPILVGYNTKIGLLSKKIVINFNSNTFDIRIGWGGTESRETGRKNYFSLSKNGKIVFNGKCILSSGLSLIVDNGELSIGKDFFCNKNCSISCNEKITIGNNCLWGWNVELLDSDNHKIYSNNQLKQGKQEIKIGEHVWFAAYVNVLKGSEISDGSIVAYKSVVTKKFFENNILLGGYPAKVLEHNVRWEG